MKVEHGGGALRICEGKGERGERQGEGKEEREDKEGKASFAHARQLELMVRLVAWCTACEALKGEYLIPETTMKCYSVWSLTVYCSAVFPLSKVIAPSLPTRPSCSPFSLPGKGDMQQSYY